MAFLEFLSAATRAQFVASDSSSAQQSDGGAGLPRRRIHQAVFESLGSFGDGEAHAVQIQSDLLPYIDAGSGLRHHDGEELLVAIASELLELDVLLHRRPAFMSI